MPSGSVRHSRSTVSSCCGVILAMWLRAADDVDARVGALPLGGAEVLGARFSPLPDARSGLAGGLGAWHPGKGDMPPGPLATCKGFKRRPTTVAPTAFPPNQDPKHFECKRASLHGRV